MKERNSLPKPLTEFKNTEKTPVDATGSSEVKVIKNETEVQN